MKFMRRIISAVLAIIMVVLVIPGTALPIFAAEEASVEYITILPEYILLNAYTGKDSSVFNSLVKGSRDTSFYNALNMFHKYKGTDGKGDDYFSYSTKYGQKQLYNNKEQSAIWDAFTSTNIYKIANNEYAGVQVGTSAYFYNDIHSHSWWSGVFTKTTQDVTSYAYESLSLDGSCLRWISGAAKSSSSETSIGVMDYSDITTGVAGGKGLVLQCGLSRGKLGNGSYCNGCDAAISNQTVCFYDGTAPYAKSVKLSGGADGSNFKAGDTITVTIQFNEVMRFADNSSKHGDSYVELMLYGETAGSANNPKAKLQSLKTVSVTENGSSYEASEAVFTYTVPSDSEMVKTITAVNLDTLIKETSLIHIGNDKTLDFKTKKVIKGNTAIENISLSKSGTGYTTATSPFVDAAGNSLKQFGQHTVKAYIDCVGPEIIAISADANTNSSTGSEDLDNSSLYLGKGDSIIFTAYFSEELKVSNNDYNKAVATTNLKNGSGEFITLNAVSNGLTNKYGEQYGKAASNGNVRYITFKTLDIIGSDSMTCADSDGVIRITNVEFPNNTSVTDASNNAYVAVSDLRNKNVNLSKRMLDNIPPVINGNTGVTAVSGSDKYAGFYYQVEIKDENGSGVEGLTGSFSLADKAGSTFSYQWAAAAEAGKSADTLTWNDGTSGITYKYLQHKGGKTYFYIRFIADQKYNLRNFVLSVSAADYAGNISSAAPCEFEYIIDNVGPDIAVSDTQRSLNDSKTEGTLTVNFIVSDANGFDTNNAESVQYVWADTDTDSAPDSGWAAPTAAGSAENGTKLSYKASFTVAEKNAVTKTLWVKAADVFGNTSAAIKLGTYKYDLTNASYAINTPVDVTKDPYATLSSLGDGDAVLSLFRTTDMKSGDDKVWFAVYSESAGGALFNKNADTANLRTVTVTEVGNHYELKTVAPDQLSDWKTDLENESYYGEIEFMFFAGKKYQESSDSYTGSFNGNTADLISVIGAQSLVTVESRIVRTCGDGSSSPDPLSIINTGMSITEADGLERFKLNYTSLTAIDGYKYLEAGNGLLSNLDSLTFHITLGDNLMPEWGVDTYDFSLADDGYTKTRLEVVYWYLNDQGYMASKVKPVSLQPLTSQDVVIPHSISEELGSGIYTVRLNASLKSGRLMNSTDESNDKEGYYYYKADGSMGIGKYYSVNALQIMVDASGAASDFSFSSYSINLNSDAENNSFDSYVDEDAIIGSKNYIDRAAHMASESSGSVTPVIIPLSKTVNLNGASKTNTAAGGFKTTLYLTDSSKNVTKYYCNAASSGTYFYSGIRWAKITNTVDGKSISKWAVYSAVGVNEESVQLNILPVDTAEEMQNLEADYKAGTGINSDGSVNPNTLVMVRGKTNVLTVELYSLSGEKSETKVLYVNCISDPVTGSIKDIAYNEAENDDNIYCYDASDGGQNSAEYTERVKTVFTPAAGTDTDGLRVFIDEIGKQYSYDNSYIGSAHNATPDDEMTLNSDGTYSYVWDTAYSGMYAITCYNEKTNYFSTQIISYGSNDYGSSINHVDIKFDDGAPLVYKDTTASQFTANSDLTNPVLTDNGDGTWSLSFAVKDTVIEECGEMTLTLKPSEEYAQALGLAADEEFNFTFAKHTIGDSFCDNVTDSSGSYYSWEKRKDSTAGASVWRMSEKSSLLGIYYAEAEYRKYNNGGGQDYQLAFVTVTGAAPSLDSGNANVGFTAVVKDRFGNTSDSFELTKEVAYKAPEVVVQASTSNNHGYPYLTWTGETYELVCRFNQPVSVKKSWKCLNPSGYAVVDKTGEIPVTADGDAVIEVYDVFGTLREINYKFEDVFTHIYGTQNPQRTDNVIHDVSVSISETDPTNEDVTITVTAPYAESGTMDGTFPLVEYGGDNAAKEVSVTAKENGAYTFAIYYNYSSYFNRNLNQDSITIYIDNICKKAPSAEPYFFFQSLGAGYKASELPNKNGSTYDEWTVSGNVTVSYITERTVMSTDGTSQYVVMKPDGDQSYSFKYQDEVGNSGSLDVKLSDYGIVLTEGGIAKDTNAPGLSVTLLSDNDGSGYKVAGSFSSNRPEADIDAAFNELDYFRTLRLNLSISEESSYKTIVTLATPSNLTYDTAKSDSVSGVSLSGNNVSITDKCIVDTLYLSVVDNAKDETGSAADNSVTIKIPVPLEKFDTAAPQLVSLNYNKSLYSTDAIIEIKDVNSRGTNITTNNIRNGSTSVAAVISYPEGVAREISGSSIVYKYRLTENGSKTLSFIDLAGNILSVPVATDSIDDEPTVLSVTWSPCASGTDPSTGKDTLLTDQVTDGPVNSDITAIISSTKGIKSYSFQVIIGTKDNPADNMPEAGNENWSDYRFDVSKGIDSIAIKFDASYAQYGIWAKVTITASNGKTAVKIIGFPSGVADAISPNVTVQAEPLYRQISENENAAEPYAYRLYMFPSDASRSYGAGGNDTSIYLAGNSGKSDTSGKAVRTAYTKDNPYTVIIRADGNYSYRFADKAGNQTTVYIDLPSALVNNPEDYYYIDSEGNYTNYTANDKVTLYSELLRAGSYSPKTESLLTDRSGKAVVLKHIDTSAPVITTNPTAEQLNQSAKAQSQTVTIQVDEPCTLNCSYTCEENGKTVSKSVSKTIVTPSSDTLTITFTQETVLSVTAVDASGNTARKALAISNIDNTPPVIVADMTTISVKQDSDIANLNAMLNTGVTATDTWKGVVTSITPTYDISAVKLDKVGLYTVTYTAIDSVGNKATAVRNVKVYDKNTPGVVIDGIYSDPGNLTVLTVGTHSISVTNLTEIAPGESEPYKIYIRKGMKTVGQMKNTAMSTQITNGSMELESGYYTIYVVTQSRRSFRAIVFVEK